MKKCECCCTVEDKFKAAVHDPHMKLVSTYNLMRELYRQQKLLLYMSDCDFEKWFEEVKLEKHYTYEAYLKCGGCGKIYHFGVCIRGEPVYEVLDWEPDKEEFIYQCLRNGKQFYES